MSAQNAVLSTIFDFPRPYLDKSLNGDGTQTIPVTILTEEDYERWSEGQPSSVRNHLKRARFTAKPGQGEILYCADGEIEQILAGVSTPVKLYDICKVVNLLKEHCSEKGLEETCFTLPQDLSAEDLTQLCSGWGLACYHFDTYKSKKSGLDPKLVWPASADRNRVEACVESVFILKNLINLPANDLGTDELAEAAKHAAKQFSASCKIISGRELEKDFPLIHTVGKASDKKPCLIDMHWGDKKNPCVTLVGKGIVFDSGGLNIKPGRWMQLMKKDMGGAAHTLGLAWHIMKMDLPVYLRVLLPIAENSIAGASMRPSDVVKSRAGVHVEIKDTDAEGRLVLADALSLAVDDKPDLIIDMATLTGAARAALGFDIPAIFSNKDSLADALKETSLSCHDPLWPLPLWQPYTKDISSNIADIANDGVGMAGSIYAALFLHRFVGDEIDWIHLDMYAWEQNGKPGRPKGGADTGMRALFALLEKRYS